MLSEYIENNQFSMYEFSIEQGSTFDLELSKKQYLAAINLLKAYLKEDETFKEQADTHISICNSHIEDLPKFMGHRTKRFFQWSGKMGERF